MSHDHENLPASRFVPMTPNQWPESIQVTGSMHTPMLDPAAAEAIAKRIEQETLDHMKGVPMPGWEVPMAGTGAEIAMGIAVNYGSGMFYKGQALGPSEFMVNPPAQWPASIGVDPGAPGGDQSVLAIRGEAGRWNGITIKSRDAKPVPMLTKQVDRILANHGRPRPPTMPKTLAIFIRPSYPWFHSCGYAVGHACVSQPLRPMRIIALAVQYLVAAPTLTHQA